MALPNALELVPLHTLLFQWHERISFSIGGVKHAYMKLACSGANKTVRTGSTLFTLSMGFYR